MRIVNAERRRRAEHRSASKHRQWVAREAQAYQLYQLDPTPAKRRAWLRTWHDEPTFVESSE